MRDAIASWTFAAYDWILPLAQVGFLVACLVLVPMAFVPRLRSTAGSGLFLLSFLFGATTWLLGAGLTFAVWGWVGLILGLLFLGLGVVPLGALGAFFKTDVPEAGLWLIGMAAVTLGARIVGGLLMERSAAGSSEPSGLA